MPQDDPPLQCTLSRHPAGPCRSTVAVEVSVAARARTSIAVEYRIVGALDGLRVALAPTRLDPERLWAHTCCELFAGPTDGPEYIEWNFSSTGQAAAFEFSAYRVRRPTSTAQIPTVEVTLAPHELCIRASVSLPPMLQSSTRLAVTTVLEDTRGDLSYWALQHPHPRPDFHDRRGFALALTHGGSPAIVRLPEAP